MCFCLVDGAVTGDDDGDDIDDGEEDNDKGKNQYDDDAKLSWFRQMFVVNCITIHSFSFRLLRQSVRRSGLKYISFQI